MKKQIGYIILTAVFITAVGFVVIKYRSKQQAEKNAAYILLPRGGQSNNPEWTAAKKNTDNLLAKIKMKLQEVKRRGIYISAVKKNKMNQEKMRTKIWINRKIA